MTIEVYGQQIEPICSYRRCHHKFSEHGHNCKKLLWLIMKYQKKEDTQLDTWCKKIRMIGVDNKSADRIEDDNL